MNDLICISSIVIAIKLSDWTPNSWMWITKSITCSRLLTGTIWSINAKPRSHVKFGLLWLDCDSQIKTKLANWWGIFDPILKKCLFDAQSFRFKKETFWSQESSPWCWRLPGSASSSQSCLYWARALPNSLSDILYYIWVSTKSNSSLGNDNLPSVGRKFFLKTVWWPPNWSTTIPILASHEVETPPTSPKPIHMVSGVMLVKE